MTAPYDGPFGTRVVQASTTTGTGTMDLTAPGTGYRSFVDVFGNSTVVPYLIVNADGSEWEEGFGTVTDATPDTLSRNPVASSNGGALVSFTGATTIWSGVGGGFLNSILSCHKNDTRPTWLPAGGIWADDTTNPVVIYYFDGTDDIQIGSVDESANDFLPAFGDPAQSRSDLGAQEDVITTRGDLVYGNSSNVAARLALGTSGYYLRSNGTDLAWSQLSASDLATGTVPAARLPAATESSVGALEIATAAEAAAAASDAVIMTPAKMSDHPGVSKAWCVIDESSTGVPALTANAYNVSSLTDEATGRGYVTLGITMADTQFLVTASDNATGNTVTAHDSAISSVRAFPASTTTVRFTVYRTDTTTFFDFFGYIAIDVKEL